ncbi:hypothetical protein LTR53_010595 [Teratosphaeriaceae sp. CCFEE 6253]|nr:hypothetical protein LTR53_010595 [Teratosphaeriaceae sp. CCFEE 6253]
MYTLRTRLISIPSHAAFRPLSTSAPLRALADKGPPTGNMSPGAKQAGRSSQPADDAQSNASAKDPDENLSGDDHPAKQPDAQAPSERSTGFNESAKDGVKGGKEGLDQRTDK